MKQTGKTALKRFYSSADDQLEQVTADQQITGFSVCLFFLIVDMH